ncbi:cdc27 protein [Ophiostoma piceae UAMH 11346]|uniref:Cdc27 protein n=1 Tax=Ophiostoma piceae (strain UAMH 11346) TaxID=1262450 RepID=S3C7M6_OPHP1|nr:cdc27 protein [Ophiostoma piceae UAMH 11346]
MAPNNTAVTGLLRQTIYYHLDNGSWDNALFFSERLSAQDARSHESAYLLALSHFRLGDHRSAYEVSKPNGCRGLHLGCAFVFAQSCLALERYRDGALALEKSKKLWIQKTSLGKHSATTRAASPDAATVNCLLGKLYRGMDDKKKAAAYFEDSLRLNPLMWDAFTALCDIGLNVRVSNTFRINEAFVQSLEPDSLKGSQEAAPGYLTEQQPPFPTKRSAAANSSRAAGIHDMSDPFDHLQAQAQPAHPNHLRSGAATHQNSNNISTATSAAESEENDFMARILAARSRAAAASGLGGSGQPSPDTATTSLGMQAEPPQALMRRRAGAPVSTGVTDTGVSDGQQQQQQPQPQPGAPSKIMYRLGAATRRGRNLDAGGDPTGPAEHTSSLLRSTASATNGSAAGAAGAGVPTSTGAAASSLSISTTERKRTASGHPVPPRQLAGAQQDESGVPQRRSARLNMFKASSGRTNTGASAIGTTATRELKKARPPISKIIRPGSSGSTVGRVCPDALQILKSLPRQHIDTPWVQALMGRAHYELASYAEAEEYFRRVRVLAPTRLEDMEVYSTILWFLKRETELSFLAHELVDAAWQSPQAWCALGNAWSLAQDHEQALRCFRRATQLNPKFAYAYTLQGHEHVLNEEYDKALTAYRHAVAADQRHYNAYYGIGRVYEKLGNFDKAFTHFRTASSIHPTNAVLICCIGKVLERQKQILPALEYFSKATELAPRAAQTRFRKARALLAIGQLQAAQEELMILKDLAPDEAPVHFLLGKLYKTLNDKSSAVRHFTIALSLDPKAGQKIKQAIGSLEDDEDGLEDYMGP